MLPEEGSRVLRASLELQEEDPNEENEGLEVKPSRPPKWDYTN